MHHSFTFIAVQTCLILLQSALPETLPPGWLSVIANGGIGIIMFVVWYFTFTKFFSRQDEYLSKLLEILKQDNEYKQLLAGILTRVESKLDQALYQRNNSRKEPV